MPRSEKRFYEFGSFRLDLKARVLMRDTEIVQLTPKAFDTLLVLVERGGELVERRDLLKTVWPDVCVEENNLNSNIFMLRRALGENSEGQNYITTVPRRGYRFVAEVREIVSVSELGGRRFQSASKSLAVLPFKTLGMGISDDHLDLGLADALITRFSNLNWLAVRPTSFISKFRGREADPIVAGGELGVELILEGNIQHSDGRIRVTVQLVSVSDGLPVWAGKFDEPFTDIFTVEDVVSARVAEALTDQLILERSVSETF
ncbi:MAG TPA: winged helix-turn-helix domain-containing protein [Blastocatellia bacterium]|nr:winged helix-turn-helix domain-containing protein [Blastocatellia bacterium]